ncbi:hypothetical protein [Urbifossiella limnaea]|uniref:Uncharacterized protein n=1 Tax=Urbifossiella limnaea TaxID=2528023 RepID=A0A517XLP6_9BACT|nr:hypothetical protein [Urbifossiella limnaea]QDU18424.1 hypothetical protein ETAA1_03100 [Urbifossiella limnaea]
MRRRGRVVHGPGVRLLCVACVAAGGCLCLWFAVALPWVVAGDADPPDDWLEGVGEWWPFAVLLAGAGLLQLAVAGWGVWSWGSAEGAG